MSRIKLDSMSEETLNSAKVVRGPKSAAVILAVTDEIDISDQKNKFDNKTITDEIRAKNQHDALENIKLQLCNAIEEASEQSAQTRLNGFKKITDILIHHYIPEIVDGRKLGITELAEKSLRHASKGLDQAEAAKTAVLLVIQLGNHYDRVQLMTQYMVKAVSDESNEINARAECCSALGIMHFLRDVNNEDIEEVMRLFGNIFDIGNKALISESESVLHSAALFSWGLLFTKVSSEYSNSSTLPTFTNYLIKLLDSPNLNLRVAAGETLCIILEHCRATNNTSLIETIEELVEVTKFLSNDTQKFRHKDDLKTQRATFRDISRYIEENIEPNIKVVFGPESIEIKSWSLHQQYVALCSIIGPGMVTHLTQNEFIRKALNVDEISMPLYEKSYKQEMHNESDRMRTLERRDDRRYKSDGLGRAD